MGEKLASIGGVYSRVEARQKSMAIIILAITMRHAVMVSAVTPIFTLLRGDTTSEHRLRESKYGVIRDTYRIRIVMQYFDEWP